MIKMVRCDLCECWEGDKCYHEHFYGHARDKQRDCRKAINRLMEVMKDSIEKHKNWFTIDRG